MTTHIKLFENIAVRTHWDAENETWLFSIVDVVAALTESVDPSAYWRKLKQRLLVEGNQTVTNCHGLKMQATDGKMRLTDVATTAQLLRLVQSIPSPKAEPLKQWLAQVGYERIQELDDPELAFDRAMSTYLKKGYSTAWINQRLKSIEVRKELTDEWEARGIEKGKEFAILTDDITKAWSGLNTKEYKAHKGLKNEGLRDNMTNLELVLNMLAEATTTEIVREKQPTGLTQNRSVAVEAGTIAGNTRKAIEAQTGKQIVSKANAQQLISNKVNKKPRKP